MNATVDYAKVVGALADAIEELNGAGAAADAQAEHAAGAQFARSSRGGGANAGANNRPFGQSLVPSNRGPEYDDILGRAESSATPPDSKHAALVALIAKVLENATGAASAQLRSAAP